MKSKALEVWISLFTDTTCNIWETEREELKKAAMIIEAAKCEFKRIELVLEEKLEDYQKKLQSADQQNHELTNLLKTSNKKVERDSVTPTKLSKNSIISTVSDDSHLNHPTADTDLSTANKDSPENLPTPNRSPRLNKHIQFYRKKKDLCLSSFSGSSSPLEEAHSINLLNAFREAPKLNLNTPKSEINKYLDFDEPCIIQSTPGVELSKRPKSYRSRQKKKPKQTESAKTSWMSTSSPVYMPLPAVLTGSVQKNKNASPDSCTLMEIDDIINEINEKSPEKTDCLDVTNILNSNCNESEEEDFVDCSIDNTASSKSRFFKNKENTKPVSHKITSTFARDYDRFPEKQSSPVATFVYKTETVRGKARMQLQGWTCNECKNFYEGMGLPPEKLKEKIDACSKHRNKFAPSPDNTPPGFWDLATPPM